MDVGRLARLARDPGHLQDRSAAIIKQIDNENGLHHFRE